MAALGSLYPSNLLELLSNPTKSTQLQIELAITVDLGNVFKATYNLEEDSPLYCHIFTFLYCNYSALSQHCCYLLYDHFC